ncbi:uncharacterized protein LOC110815507 isoform X2 [Carica papaya]|uniref:uncharacterized protein LOC110815507 isoform X2 n=1 Tax=Carica papaya TaxID=3649 RepID=UPI000B8D1AFE|nr:uncharacterized protein LOC110815507 isoform X2 [Carica papaya]
MALLRRLQRVRAVYQTVEAQEFSHLTGSSRSYFPGLSLPELYSRNFSSCLYKNQNALPWTQSSTTMLHSRMGAELLIFVNDKRFLAVQAQAHPQARQMSALKVSMLSPGFIYEPYAPREKISFWKRWFTRSGWKRTKEDSILELKSAYAIAKLRRTGYSKQKFYQEAINLYKEINTLLVIGDKSSLRKAVTENMYSVLKNEIKQRESMWSKVYWEMVEPVVRIRTLRARLESVLFFHLLKASVNSIDITEVLLHFTYLAIMKSG